MEVDKPCRDVGQPCQWDQQCTFNATCAASGVCTCIKGFYDNRGKCDPLLVPESPCGGLGQCIENAECTSPEGGVCFCNKGFFLDGDKCVPVKVSLSVPVVRVTVLLRACLCQGDCVLFKVTALFRVTAFFSR